MKRPVAAEEDDTPQTLADYGYGWVDGKLRDKEGNPFKYDVYPTKRENQNRYEAIGELITLDVYRMLETDYHLKRTPIPLKKPDTKEKAASEEGEEEEEKQYSFVFHSTDVYTNSEKLMVFLNGAGVVRAGQWSRKVIMNGSLEEGTMFPYIQKGLDLGYAILVMNTNQRGVQSMSYAEHARTAWEDIVSVASAKQIVIIAHSAGGASTMSICAAFPDDVLGRVSAVLFTDSVHGTLPGKNEDVDKKLAAVGKNYVSSREEGGKRLAHYGSTGSLFVGLSSKYQIPAYSSGSDEHIWTSHFARPHIFADLDLLEKNKE